jgi:pilus assembly protein CpaB
MMTQKRKTGVVLALALLCGGAAALIAVTLINKMPPRLVAAPTREVAVAVQDLALGALVKPEDVRLVRWPADALPAGYYTSPADVVGRGLITPIRANEPLMAGKLAGKGEGGGMPPLIPDGMRALSVSVNQVIAVAGFVTPGTRVDVLLTIEKEGQPVTRVFQQNMTVLAANQQIIRDEEGKPLTVSIVTFLVTPEQAEKLTLATKEGQIQLVLRNRADVEEVATRGARLADLGGSRPREAAEPAREQSPAPAAAAAPREDAPRKNETVVETYRGGQRSVSTFSNENP